MSDFAIDINLGQKIVNQIESTCQLWDKENVNHYHSRCQIGRLRAILVTTVMILSITTTPGQ